jgi:hypothetical protein
MRSGFSVGVCKGSTPGSLYDPYVIWQEACVGQTGIMCLMDHDVPESSGQKTPRELNEIVNRADAYILGTFIVLFGCNSFNH